MHYMELEKFLKIIQFVVFGVNNWMIIFDENRFCNLYGEKIPGTVQDFERFEKF